MEHTERRKGRAGAPSNPRGVLNELQMLTLRNIERFGWELRFIRRPSFKDPVPVVYSADGRTIGVIEEDGKLDINAAIKIRDE